MYTFMYIDAYIDFEIVRRDGYRDPSTPHMLARSAQASVALRTTGSEKGIENDYFGGGEGGGASGN
jgi:hypothetical protein